MRWPRLFGGARTTAGDGGTFGDRFAMLLDNLRALSSDAAIPKVVLAGVSGREHLGEITHGLLTEAEGRGFQLLLAELAAGTDHRILRCHPEHPGSHVSATTPAPLEVTGNPPPAITRRWLEETATGHDFLLIEAPPLQSSVEAALLARYCDGLVILAETDVTGRLELKAAVERARAAGCTILGLVMIGVPTSQPYWLRKLLPRTIL
jgi:hypothetical protein